MAQGKKTEIHIGDRYNMLTIIHDKDIIIKGIRCALCRCDCGEVKSIPISGMVTDRIRSCGCLASHKKVKKVEEYFNPLWD